jgi:hypothetical protein
MMYDMTVNDTIKAGLNTMESVRVVEVPKEEKKL